MAKKRSASHAGHVAVEGTPVPLNATTPSTVARVVAYIRVSSLGQDLATQRHAIENVRTDVSDWHEEKASAKRLARPVLTQLLKEARMGKFNTLVVFKLDRLCRSGVRDTFKVVEELRQAGVTLIAVADHLTIRPDSEDIASEVMIFALSLAAKLERQAIAERIAAARTRLKAQGEPWGRPPSMTRANKDTALKMRSEGKTLRAIAGAIGVSRSTIGEFLKTAEVEEASAS